MKGFMMAVTDPKTWMLMGILYSVSCTPHSHLSPSRLLSRGSRGASATPMTMNNSTNSPEPSDLHRRRRRKLFPLRRRRPWLLPHNDLRPHRAPLPPLRYHHASQRLPLRPQARTLPPHRRPPMHHPCRQHHRRLNNQHGSTLRRHDAPPGFLLRCRSGGALVDHGQSGPAFGQARECYCADQRHVQYTEYLGQLSVLWCAEIRYGVYCEYCGDGFGDWVCYGDEDLVEEVEC